MKWKIVPISYAVSVLCAVLAVYLVMIGRGNDGVGALAACVVIQFLFAFAAIAELNGSPSLTIDQKKFWRHYLLSSPLVFGFFYFRKLRKKIILF